MITRKRHQLTVILLAVFSLCYGSSLFCGTDTNFSDENSGTSVYQLLESSVPAPVSVKPFDKSLAPNSSTSFNFQQRLSPVLKCLVFTVSLFERNTFYYLTTINAP